MRLCNIEIEQRTLAQSGAFVGVLGTLRAASAQLRARQLQHAQRRAVRGQRRYEGGADYAGAAGTGQRGGGGGGLSAKDGELAATLAQVDELKVKYAEKYGTEFDTKAESRGGAAASATPILLVVGVIGLVFCGPHGDAARRFCRRQRAPTTAARRGGLEDRGVIFVG